MAQSGPGTPCETSITLIPASARAIRPPYSAGRGSGGRRAGRDCRQTKLPQNFRLVCPQPRRAPRDRGHISPNVPVRPAHATRTARAADRLDHLVCPGLGMVVHEMAARFVSQIEGAGNTVGFEDLFPLPRGLLFEGLFENGDQRLPIFDPLCIGHKPWVRAQLWPSQGCAQPCPDPVMDRRYAEVSQGSWEGLIGYDVGTGAPQGAGNGARGEILGVAREAGQDSGV